MAAPLVPCPHCLRHVKVTDRACPFCSSTLDTNAMYARVPAQNIGPKRLDRLAIFTFATAVSVAACSTGGGGLIDEGSTTDGGGKSDGGPKDDGGVQALYGMPYDGGNVQPPYGVPRIDAGDDGGGLQGAYGLPPTDASADDGGVQALYGLPPPDGGTD